MAYTEVKSAIKEIIKIKKADNKSILKERESKGKGEPLTTKATVCSEIIVATEKSNPHKEPAMAKKLLQIFAALSSFLSNKEPIAPTKKSERKIKKLIGDVIISNILF